MKQTKIKKKKTAQFRVSGPSSSNKQNKTSMPYVISEHEYVNNEHPQLLSY